MSGMAAIVPPEIRRYVAIGDATANAVIERVQRMISVIDDKYKDLPGRVTKLSKTATRPSRSAHVALLGEIALAGPLLTPHEPAGSGVEMRDAPGHGGRRDAGSVNKQMLEEILWWTRELLADPATLDTEKRLAGHLQALTIKLIRVQGNRQQD